jgi:hypothetical protein
MRSPPLASLSLALLALTLPAAAQTRKLNGPLARDASGALFPGGSPDGRFLYYTRQPEGSAAESLAVELDGKHAPFAAPAPLAFTRDG